MVTLPEVMFWIQRRLYNPNFAAQLAKKEELKVE